MSVLGGADAQPLFDRRIQVADRNAAHGVGVSSKRMTSLYFAKVCQDDGQLDSNKFVQARRRVEPARMAKELVVSFPRKHAGSTMQVRPWERLELLMVDARQGDFGAVGQFYMIRTANDRFRRHWRAGRIAGEG